MVRAGRYVYVALVWVFLLALALQIFFAGLGLFGSPPDISLHRGFGWLLHLPPLLILIAALVGRVGRPTIWWVLALFLTVAIEPFLPGLRDTAPLLAALHPLNAVVISVITIKLAVETPRFLQTEAMA